MFSRFRIRKNMRWTRYRSRKLLKNSTTTADYEGQKGHWCPKKKVQNDANHWSPGA